MGAGRTRRVALGRAGPGRALLAGGVSTVLLACGGGGSDTASGTGNGAANTTTTATPALSPSTTAGPAAPSTTAAPNLAEGLDPIDGCPVPPAMAGPDPDRPVYAVTVDARPADGTAEGELRVRFTPDLATDVLVFRLWPNGPRAASAGAELEVGGIVSEGRTLPATRPDPTTVEAALPDTLAPGSSVEVSMPWRLTVPAAVNDRVSGDADTLRLGSFLPLLAWEPGVGWARDPATALFAEAVTSPVADYELTITVPEGYDVLATGTPEAGARGTRRWRAEAVRDVSVAVGHFAVASRTEALPEPVAVTVGVDAAVGEDPAVYLERVSAALRDFAARYGAYPWPTFNLAVTPGLGGGIEFPANVLQGPETQGRTTPHEVAHMWFYGLVGNNQGRDPWLDEGLASYAEFRHEGELAARSGNEIPAAARGRAGEPMTFWEDRADSYYRGVYVQPAVALAGLGTVDQLDCALRHYVAANAYGIATPEDLYGALEVVLPDARARLAGAGLGS